MIIASIKTFFAIIFAIDNFIIVLSLKALVSNNFILLLKRILCIYYLIQFKKNQVESQVLIKFSSEINAMTFAFAKQLNF